jgi:DnaJ-class molecular chaperone
MLVCRRRLRGLRSFDVRRFREVFGGIFGDFFGGGRRPGRKRSADLEITFEESAKGVETTVDTRLETRHLSRLRRGARHKRDDVRNARDAGSNDSSGFFTVARTCSRCRARAAPSETVRHVQG